MTKAISRKYAFYAGSIATFAVFLYIIFPYLGTIIVAYVSALFLYPLYVKLRKYKKMPEWLAIVISVLVFFLLFAIPLAILFTATAKEAQELIKQISYSVALDEIKLGSGQERILYLIDTINDTTKQIPFYEYELTLDDLYLAAQSVVAWFASSVSDTVISIGSSIVTFLTSIFVFIVMFYTILPRFGNFENSLKQISPMSNKATGIYVTRTNGMIKDTVKGTLIVALIQGVLAGILLYLLGVPYALLLTFFMIILALLPYVGTALIMIPISIIYLLMGNILFAIIIIAWQILVVGTIDNLLRPKLMSKDSNLNAALLFIVLIGGMKAFGFMGLLYGPLIAALLKASYDIFKSEYMEK